MKKKIILFISIAFFFIIFLSINYKIKNNGNNINKSLNVLEDILSINSYEAEIDVVIQSNKTTNKYKIKQIYCRPNRVKQIIKEPSNLENITIIYDSNNLKIENTNLGLSKIYENYKYINENCLWLNSFVEHYNNNSKIIETENEIIVENKNNLNKYNKKQVLYISKKNKKPIKMEIFDDNKNSKIYIKYNEIKINNIDNLE